MGFSGGQGSYSQGEGRLDESHAHSWGHRCHLLICACWTKNTQDLKDFHALQKIFIYIYLISKCILNWGASIQFLHLYRLFRITSFDTDSYLLFIPCFKLMIKYVILKVIPHEILKLKINLYLSRPAGVP